MAVLMPEGRQSFEDSAGRPLVGGKVYTYTAGTSAPLATYVDPDGVTPNTNPIILNARGEATIFWSGSYKVTLTDANDAVIWTQDNIVSTDVSSPVTAAIAALKAELADSLDPLKGAGMEGFNPALNYAASTVGWGIRTAVGLTNALRYVPPAEWPAILDGTSNTDLTTYVQTGITAESLFFPRGKWPVSATAGIVLPPGRVIRGAGYNQTIFWAILGTGGSLAQLAAYTAGSVFRRQFNVAPGTNQYVSGIDMDDIGIILNHPTASITTTAIQIGIDLRNISRSRVGRGVYVGNYAPERSFVTKASPPAGFAQQGYGIPVGNVASGLSSYAGGEGNMISARVWGAYKLIVLDDATLSPSSAAHDTIVAYADMQGGHHQLVQESQYTSGVTWFKNTTQFCIKQNGDASSSYAMRFTGYDSFIGGGCYAELGANTDYVLRLEPASHGNDVTLGHFSGSAGCLVSDVGTNNWLRYSSSTAVLPAVNTDGPLIELYNKAYRSGNAKATVSGGVVTMVSSVGEATIVRVGVGRFRLDLARPMPNANWFCEMVIENASAAFGGAVAISASQSPATAHFFTYTQAAGVTSNVDPVTIYAHFHQR